MVILGIDPGYRKTGYGIVSVNQGQLSYVSSGTINLMKKEAKDKFTCLASTLEDLILEFKPTVGVFEEVFFSKNAQSTIKLGKILGISQFILLRAGIEIADFAPRHIKKALTGKGNASKEDVAAITTSILHVKDLPLDESDALAACLCYYVFSMQPKSSTDELTTIS